METGSDAGGVAEDQDQQKQNRLKDHHSPRSQTRSSGIGLVAPAGSRCQPARLPMIRPSSAVGRALVPARMTLKIVRRVTTTGSISIRHSGMMLSRVR